MQRLPVDTRLFGGAGEDRSEAFCGDELRWGLAIPWAFRALSLPDDHVVMPAVPGEDLFAMTVYWGPLLHLLLFGLGWSMPALGLQRWKERGQPDDDPTLSLVRRVWGADGGLDGFTSWLAQDHPSFPNLYELALPAEQARIGDATRASRLVLPVAVPFSTMWNVGGGTDPLHLASHTSVPLRADHLAPLWFSSDRASRRAVLMLESMVGWYRALVDATTGLLSLGERSWHVDLHVAPVGHMGTYRRSRTTGLWFTGRHRTHTMGAA